MGPVLVLILSKVLDFVSNNADEIVKAIKEEFGITEEHIENSLLNDFVYEPSEEKLNKLYEVLKGKNKDADKLASILINKTEV